MSTGEKHPAAHFDHNSQAHADDPTGSYRMLRESNPVAWSEANGGYWILADYGSVFDAARSNTIFSSARSSAGGEGLSVIIPKTPMGLHIPNELDPPESRKYRKLVNLVTAPAAIARMVGMIDDYTTWFIDQVIENGTCDFTDIIGVPAIVTIDWLGLPVEEWQRYAVAHHATVSVEHHTPEFIQATQVDLPELSSQMRQIISDRRVDPKDDVISFLVGQEIDGRAITDSEVFSIVDLLVSGGTGTTASLVSQTLVWLFQHQDVRQRLIDDPALLERAIEEFLRFFTPTQANARTVVQDVEFHGCPMRAGDRALISWASANRDAESFEAPDEIDIDRWPNRHTAFGIGVHRCAGAHLARAMAHSLLGHILERMPDYSIDVDALERYPQQGILVGFRRIPATFTPGTRRLPAPI
jgi:cytochrome P450